MPQSSNKSADDSQSWELFERCLLPIVFSHAVAVIVSTILNTLGISQISSISLFLLFLTISLSLTLFYHNLKVKYFLIKDLYFQSIKYEYFSIKNSSFEPAGGY